MRGGKDKFHCLAVRVEPAGGARAAAVCGAELGARAGVARGALASRPRSAAPAARRFAT